MVVGKTAPDFWFEPFSWQALLLSPVGSAYGSIAARRMANAEPEKINAPVLCVGNFTVGGTGKTPTARKLVEEAQQMGLRPGIILRGYGGKQRKPHLVDPATDTAETVGDEALLYAKNVTTVVGADRAAAAKALRETGCDLLIMDDGFQSRGLHYDYALITVDARRGFGNRQSVPAGPLRAPLPVQMSYADMLLFIGEGPREGETLRVAARAAKPLTHASVAPVQAKTLLRKKMIAYSGIGDPEKFFQTIRAHGGNLVHAQPFPDHHEFTELDASALLDAARRKKLSLVTTEKDWVRLEKQTGLRGELAEKSAVLRVELEFADPGKPKQIIQATMANYQTRKLESGL